MRVTNNKTVRTFLNLRFYLVYTVLLAYILYDWFNLHNFLLVLAITLVSVILLGVVVTRIKQKRRDAKAEQSAP
jgi:Na+-driven multidrug efflux pump